MKAPADGNLSLLCPADKGVLKGAAGHTHRTLDNDHILRGGFYPESVKLNCFER
jgi:hypothetical protein